MLSSSSFNYVTIQLNDNKMMVLMGPWILRSHLYVHLLMKIKNGNSFYLNLIVELVRNKMG